MGLLLIAGNTNEMTFANAIVAGNHRCGGLGTVLAVHSSQSLQILGISAAWKNHIKQHGVDPEIIIHFLADLESPGGMRRLVKQIQAQIIGLERDGEILVDLTNGTSSMKTILSVIGFVLGVNKQFQIDLKAVGKPPGFYGPEVLSEAYVPFPDIKILDDMAAAAVTEIRRYQHITSRPVRLLSRDRMSPAAQEVFSRRFFRAFTLLVQGQQKHDVAELSEAASSFGKTFELLVGELHSDCASTKDWPAKRLSLSRRIAEIDRLVRTASNNARPNIFSQITDPLLIQRNFAAHEETSGLGVARVRARLCGELLLCLVEYLDSLEVESAKDDCIVEPPVDELITEVIPPSEVKDGELMYYGLDGDDTGRELERLFSASAGDEEFRKYSRSIQGAINSVAKHVRSMGGAVLFSAGDDILFHTRYRKDLADELMRMYLGESGRTCSVGFGRTKREAYVALKIAKAQPGKNTCLGLQILKS